MCWQVDDDKDNINFFHTNVGTPNVKGESKISIFGTIGSVDNLRQVLNHVESQGREPNQALVAWTWA